MLGILAGTLPRERQQQTAGNDIGSDNDCCYMGCVLLACTMAIVINGKAFATEGDQQSRADTTVVDPARRQPYCGLYCLYAAVKLEGKEIRFRDLVKPEYIGSREGSSLQKLRKAAKGGWFGPRD